MAAIQISALQKSFGNEDLVLKDIDLSIEDGEMVALIGPSGSGKSTLLRHLSGLCVANRSSTSRITVDGREVQAAGKLAPGIRQTRAHIGCVFQQFNLINRLSVLTNVVIGGLSRMPLYRSMTGIYTREEKIAALRALETVGMRDFALRRASELSGGQQQRVAIARALMQNARVILADEPIASLDPESSRVVMETLQNINARYGITVVVTLHQVDYAQKYCKRAIALKNGAIQFDGEISSLNEARFHELYNVGRGKQSQPLEPTPADFSQALTSLSN